MALVAGLLLLWPSEVRADDEEVFGVAALVLLGATDVGFGVRATVLAAQEEDPELPTAIAETAIATPQWVVLTAATSYFFSEREGEEIFLGLLTPAVLTGSLTAHGIWSIAAPDTTPRTLLLFPTALAMNTQFSTFVIGSLASDEFDKEMIGATEVAVSLPVGVTSALLALDEPGYRAGWIAMSAWAGVLTVHGLVAAAGGLEGAGAAGDWRRYALAPIVLPPAVEGASPGGALTVSGTF